MTNNKPNEEIVDFEPYSISNVQYESDPYLFIEAPDGTGLEYVSISQTTSDDFLSESSNFVPIFFKRPLVT